jgi:hypothetical protein
LNIAAVLHVGDIVDSDMTAQWTVGPAMRELDKVVPYVVVPGNHDYSTADRKSMIENYFPPSSMPWITGTMTPGQIDNNYALVDIGPQKWLMLGSRIRSARCGHDLGRYRAQGLPSVSRDHPDPCSTCTATAPATTSTWADENQPNYQYWNPTVLQYTLQRGHQRRRNDVAETGPAQSNVRLVFSGHVMSGRAPDQHAPRRHDAFTRCCPTTSGSMVPTSATATCACSSSTTPRRPSRCRPIRPIMERLPHRRRQNQFTLDLNL